MFKQRRTALTIETLVKSDDKDSDKMQPTQLGISKSIPLWLFTRFSAENVNYVVLVPVLNMGVSIITADVFEEGLII